MRRYATAMVALAFTAAVAANAAPTTCKVLAYASRTVEADHVEFADDALAYLRTLAAKDGFTLDVDADFSDMRLDRLRPYCLVLWLDDVPADAAAREGFERYMETGGGWLGFHIAGYNDDSTHWPWFVRFLGGAVFDSNSWPPMPAQLTVEDTGHPVTQGVPRVFLGPSNEWYTWKPDPRENPDVRVLVSLAASNYPLGWKDTLVSRDAPGDLPVVWTNTRYRMLYMNMGHGDKILTSDAQKRLIENAVQWLLATPARR